METCYKELEAYNFDPERVRKCYPFLARHFERSEGSRPPIPVDSPNFREVLAKGVFPYEYIDHADRLEDAQLPPIESFHSLLRGKSATL